MLFDDALARARVRSLSTEAQLALVRDPTYWAGLPKAQDPFVPDDEGAYETRPRAFCGGLGWTPSALPDAAMSKARVAIAQVRDAGWPPVFALLTDGLWALLGHEALWSVVGERKQLPGVYVHLVERRPGARGWEPHVDVASGDALDRVTAWLALTDAPLDGGCLYLVPRSETGSISARWDTLPHVEMRDFIDAAWAARAVPLRAGGVLLWHRSSLHWGGVVERAHACPRMAISLEYGIGPLPGEKPFDPRAGLSFDERLFLLGYALSAYAGAADREPEAAPFAALGPRLLEGGS